VPTSVAVRKLVCCWLLEAYHLVYTTLAPQFSSTKPVSTYPAILNIDDEVVPMQSSESTDSLRRESGRSTHFVTAAHRPIRSFFEMPQVVFCFGARDTSGILFIDVLRVSHADSSLRVVLHLKMSVHYTAVRRSRHKMSSREGLSPHHFPVL